MFLFGTLVLYLAFNFALCVCVCVFFFFFFIFKGPVKTTRINPSLIAQYLKRSQMQRLMRSWIYLMPPVKKMLMMAV
jgi:hypothetical protein